MVESLMAKNFYFSDFFEVQAKEKNREIVSKSRFLCGRGTKTRTQKNGFGDRYVTITSYPYVSERALFYHELADKSILFT